MSPWGHPPGMVRLFLRYDLTPGHSSRLILRPSPFLSPPAVPTKPRDRLPLHLFPELSVSKYGLNNIVHQHGGDNYDD